MQKRKVFWQFFPAILLTMTLSIATILLLSHISHRATVFATTFRYMSFVGSQLQKEIETSGYTAEKFAESAGRLVEASDFPNTRIDLIHFKGELISTTSQDYMESNEDENFLDRPEVAQAFLGSKSEVERRMQNLSREQALYLALPVLSPAAEDPSTLKVSYALRLSIPEDSVQLYSTVDRAFLILFLGLMLLLVTTVSYYFAYRFSRPLELMKSYAEKIAKGDFKSRIHLEPADNYEAHRLGQAMNRVAIQLNRRINTVIRQKNERDIILASMGEGLLAIDQDQKIVMVNEVAKKILDPGLEDVRGRSLLEVFRMPELIDFVDQAQKLSAAFQRDIRVQVGDKEKVLNIKSGSIGAGEDNTRVAVYVFDDVTQVRRLESHRTDFVANVSHELRTPLTSIRGFSETLLNQDVNQEDQKRFLGIINRHASRLDEIIDDLLSLSRIEQGAESEEIELLESELMPVLSAAKELCEQKQKSSGVSVAISGEPGLKAVINKALLEQAVTNLLDNAIKYSEAGQTVDVELSEQGQEVLISVRDHGAGIEQKHLSRLFERFYRVDKSRSREAGGTGLGLAIVKHVIQAHRGRVEVESEPGKGSIFQVFLPKAQSN